MKKLLLLMMGCFFLLAAGCTFERLESEETLARPDVLWKTTWLIEERQTSIDLGTDEALLEASCFVYYQGDGMVKDVKIHMGSPLTDGLIDDSVQEKTFSVVKPGYKLKYFMDAGYPQWRERIPAAISTGKLIDDFRDNTYVSISWKDKEDEHSVRFYDFGQE
ncbi:MAG TPA: hypothetical protein GXZ24_01020 [Firmicutes bacterium]|nr:hypothetical protein [Bacillota bacterium]